MKPLTLIHYGGILSIVRKTNMIFDFDFNH